MSVTVLRDAFLSHLAASRTLRLCSDVDAVDNLLQLYSCVSVGRKPPEPDYGCSGFWTPLPKILVRFTAGTMYVAFRNEFRLLKC